MQNNGKIQCTQKPTYFPLTHEKKSLGLVLCEFCAIKPAKITCKYAAKITFDYVKLIMTSGALKSHIVCKVFISIFITFFFSCQISFDTSFFHHATNTIIQE